jgi:hypothetical protein
MPEVSVTEDPLRTGVERAVLAAVAGDPYPERRREGLLVRAVQRHLDADPEVRSTLREARARDDGWTRRYLQPLRGEPQLLAAARRSATKTPARQRQEVDQ